MSTRREQPERALVVGVDASKESLLAVAWAAAEAAARGTSLTVLHVRDEAPPAPAQASTRAYSELGRLAQEVLDRGVRQADETAPAVAVRAELVVGTPAPQLLRAAPGAEIVLGQRGAGGFAGLLLGSVGAAVAAHAAGPVVVVREHRQPAGPVLVGIDGSDHSARSMEYALRHAARHGLGVRGAARLP